MRTSLHMGYRTAISSLLCAAILLPEAPVLAASARAEKPAQSVAKPKAVRTGMATYYGDGFDGRKTASGEHFDRTEMVAAHPTYPIGTRARVTNLSNGRSQEVRINDRGPASEHQDAGVIIDVSEGVATRLGFRRKGKTRVKIEVLEWGEKTQHAGVASLR